MIRKKFFMMIVFIISCSIYAIAQTDYYYYKGKKIPLTLNEDKVCVNIYKNKNVSERIRADVQILNIISDETFVGLIITRPDFEKLTSQDSWEEDSKSVIVTASYLYENKEVFTTPYLYVKLKKEEDIGLLTSYLEKYKLKIDRNSAYMPLWYVLALTPDSEKDPSEIANELQECGDFEVSEPDLCADNLICSNDPMFNQQWGLHNSNYSGIDISVSSAWNYATGKNIKIAILDTGIDTNHFDLASNIGSLCFDTESNTSSIHIYRNGLHGTHCAGIAAAIKDNNFLIAGVAPDATIVPISNPLTLSYQNSSKLAEGINWAYENDVDIISCSWYAVPNQILDNAIQNAFIYGRHGKGCVIVFAAGNKEDDESSYDVKYPANCNETILAVGSINFKGERAFDSNYGTELDLVAPGVHILSTLPNDSVGYDSGTSMACPHVAGVAALILERNSELTVSQVNSIICSNAKKIPRVTFNYTKPDGSWSYQYGYGLVDAYNAVINTPSTVCIQNETISGTRIISAENIYVGRDVTNTKPYGDVVLGQGDITIKADYIEIKNSTTVPLGTALTIEN